MLRRDDRRIIIHFVSATLNIISSNELPPNRIQDYDCFYASVLEAENPALKSLPLAVQQKQIVVTCNYEARRRGLRKLQLIKEAKQICPDVVIILGENLTKFRDVSKSLYAYLRSFLWGKKAERLGFDEVFLDVTDLIDYNVPLLNPNDLAHSFFCLDRQDPTQGFEFDATRFCGPTFPSQALGADPTDFLTCRLILGSHLAYYIRARLDHERGYSATVGVSTSKLLAKLVGNVNKPNNQTTLIPPYTPAPADTNQSNVTQFIDDHELGLIPGIGFKSAHKLRAYFLRREPTSQPYTERDRNDKVQVRDLRLMPGIGVQKLQDILGGTGAPRDIGLRIWELLNGVDNSDVLEARDVPTQISIEDSYQGIGHFDEAKKKLQHLATSLVKRMRTDLVDSNDDGTSRWLARPRTLRLSTRHRSPRNADGSREYSYANGRISRSAPAPSFLFNLEEGVEAVAEKLVEESLTSMFRKLHPGKSFAELSLMNVAVTNMIDTAKQRGGKDIGQMLLNQEPSWAPAPAETDSGRHEAVSSEASNTALEEVATWEESEGDDESPMARSCDICGARIPAFALLAHARFHVAPD